MAELTLPEVAELCGVDRTTVLRRVMGGRLTARCIQNAQGGASGFQYLIPVSALTEEEQDRYWVRHGGRPTLNAETTPSHQADLKRLAIIRRFLDSGRSRDVAEALAAEAGIHVATLYRWVARARTHHLDTRSVTVSDDASLPVRFPRSSIPDDFLQEAVSWLLDDARRTRKEGYARLLDRIARETPPIPPISYVQFTRLLAAMTPPFADLLSYRQEGSIPVRLKKTPKILRQWSAIPAGHTYVGDQHLQDYACVDPATGEVLNLQLYLWIDGATNYWTGIAACFGPYTQYTVGLSLLDACRLHIPTALLNDNGKQEKSTYVNRLWGNLSGLIDIDAAAGRHFTTPNLPPVKPIESQMAVFTRYLNQEGLPGYKKRADDPFVNKARQARLATAKDTQELPTVDALLDAIVRVVERHNTQSCRSEVDGCSFIPAERFWRDLDGRRIVLPDAHLKSLFYPRFQRLVRNACVRVRIGGHTVEFTHPDLINIGAHEPVQVLINPLPPHDGGLVLRQCDERWEPYCPVEPWLGRGLHPLDDQETLKAAMRQKQGFLNRFRDAINSVNQKACALAGVSAPAAAKIVTLPDVARMRAADRPASVSDIDAAPRPDLTATVDHQSALRALVHARRQSA